MKKSIIVASGMVALAIGLAGCGGAKNDAEETTTAETIESTTETTTASTSEAETTQAAESTATPDTTTARTAPADFGGIEKVTNASQFYDVYVNRLKSGFKESGTSLYYTSDTGNYNYSIRDNVTRRSIEAYLDETGASLTDGDTGILNGDMYYATGRNATGSYFTTVYYNIGEGSDTDCYAAVEYLSSEKVSADDVAALLNSEYVTFAEK